MDGVIYTVCDFDTKCFRRKANEVILFTVACLKILGAAEMLYYLTSWADVTLAGSEQSPVAYLYPQVRLHEFSRERMSHCFNSELQLR